MCMEFGLKRDCGIYQGNMGEQPCEAIFYKLKGDQ